MVIIVLVLVIIVSIIVWYIGAYNSFQKSITKVEEAKSGIDIALTKRFDVLTKLLDVVNQYTKHERTVLERVIELRRNGASYSEVNNAMSQLQDSINFTVENYPQLRSSEVYQNLQLSITDVEEHLSASRRFYNSAVKSYNVKVRSFPTSIIANSNGYGLLEFFEAEESKRHDVKMKFD